MRILIFILTFSLLFCCSQDRSKKPGNTEIAAARQVLESGDFDRALNLADEIIQRDTLNGEAYFFRATCYSAMQGEDRSTPDYLKSIKLGYRIADSYFNLGLNSLSNGNDSLALKYFEKVVEINPNDKEAIFHLEILQRKERSEENQLSI